MLRLHRALVAVVLGALLGAGLTPVTPLPEAAADPVRRVLITGDSITQGSSGDYTWRYRLWKKLAATAPGRAAFVGPRTGLYDVVNSRQGSLHYAADFPAKAHGALWGDTFVHELDAIGGQVAAADADVLVVMLGSNDLAYQTSPAATIANLRTYLARARAARPGLDVVVGEVVDRYDPWSRRYLLSTQVAQYATSLDSLAKELDTPAERVVAAPTRRGWDAAVHTWDGTHPNATGEALLAQRVSEGLARIGLGSASPNVAGSIPWAVPGPPVGLTPGSEEATLAWDRTSTGANAMFVEQRLATTGEAWRRLPYAVAGDRWTAGLLAAGGTYQYRLVPVKGSSTGISGPASTTTVTGPKLGAVGAISAAEGADSLYGGTSANVTWSAAANASGYLVGSVLMSNGTVMWDNLPYPVLARTWHFEPLRGGRYYRFKAQPVRGFLRGSARVSAAVRMHGIPAGRSYAVLGDSYSSGLGSQRDYYHQGCLRSPGAWAFQMQARWQASTRHLACAGAKLGGVQWQLPAMDAFFAARPGWPQLITVTVGGNDVGFTRVLEECIVGGCLSSEATVAARITALKPRLVELYRTLKAAHPYADVLVGGYPQVVETYGPSTNVLCKLITRDERRMIDRLSTRLNTAIAVAAGTAGVWSVGSAVKAKFVGHNACSKKADEWIHGGNFDLGGIGGVLDPKSFHPKDPGQAAYAEVFSDVLIARTRR